MSKTQIDTGRLLYFTAGVGAIAALFAFLQGSTRAICCGDFDGYYHIRWSRLLWEGLLSGHFPPRFEWLPLTILNPTEYVDHHFFFHILQIPFTWSGDLRFGAKYASTVFATAALAACYGLIVRHRVRYSGLWLVALLASSSAFISRMNMAKAPSVSVAFTVLGIYLLFDKQYRWLAPLAFIFVWTYSLFVMLGLVAVIWVGVIAWTERRFEWRPAVWTGVGILLGFVINPYFPRNVLLLGEHLRMAITPAEFQEGIGLEWYPFGTWTFLNINAVASVAMLTGYIAFDPFDRKRSARALFLLIFSTILLVMTFHSLRWAEYWPPFGVLFGAFALQPILDGERGVIKQRWLKRGVLACLIIGLGVELYITVLRATSDIAANRSPEQYESAMEWVQHNVPPGEMIFNADWGDFPKLFYHDTTHRYVTGLGPYLYDKDPELFNLYEQIRMGKKSNATQVIHERFNSRYVFIDPRGAQADFYRQLKHDASVQEVFLDKYCSVLRLN